MFNPLNLGVFRLMFLVGEVYFLAPEGCVCFCLKGKVLYTSNIFFCYGCSPGIYPRHGCSPGIYPPAHRVYPRRTPVAWVYPRRKKRINPSMGQLMDEGECPMV